MSAIFTRRSVRSYLEKPVEAEKIERMLRAASQAPSAHNHQPWEFLVITRREDLEAISGMSPWAGLAAKAPLVIACLADTERAQSGDDAWWVQDLSAATENLLLQAAEEGLGGVWLGWYPDAERVRAFSKRFGLPAHVVPVSVAVIGYPDKAVEPADRYRPERVHYGRWHGKKED